MDVHHPLPQFRLAATISGRGSGPSGIEPEGSGPNIDDRVLWAGLVTHCLTQLVELRKARCLADGVEFVLAIKLPVRNRHEQDQRPSSARRVAWSSFLNDAFESREGEISNPGHDRKHYSHAYREGRENKYREVRNESGFHECEPTAPLSEEFFRTSPTNSVRTACAKSLRVDPTQNDAVARTRAWQSHPPTDAPASQWRRGTYQWQLEERRCRFSRA